MSVEAVLTIAAILLGPILAVQAERFLDRRREMKTRRESVFKTLMASRGTALAAPHVEALNRIDLEFPNTPRYRGVLRSWRLYFDHLNTPCGQAGLTLWNQKKGDLLRDLLFEMASALGYGFDKAQIQRNIYFPEAHAKLEQDNAVIRQGVLSLLKGDAPLSVRIATQAPQTRSSNQSTSRKRRSP